uniref:Sigma-54 factor interaction domain-containing protein n=1 Tax=Desulfatirhabdium butyrativorans TaxID=340467 RepID=A0A7C4W0Q1_9BACT
MKAADLNRLELIGIDQKRGFPLFGASRMIMFGATSISRLQEDLYSSLGVERTKAILARFGYEAGMHLALSIQEMYHFDSPEEWLMSGAILRTMAGYAQEEITSFEMHAEEQRLIVSGIWRDSFEATIWKAKHSIASFPVCAILSGMASGFASTVLGKSVWVKETCCMAQGSEQCRFEGKDLVSWHTTEDVFKKHFSVDSLEERLRNTQEALNKAKADIDRQKIEISRLRLLTRKSTPNDEIIFRSQAMADLLDLAKKVAPTQSTILIQGESGVGKEVLARYIHAQSGQAKHPFVAINCAAVPAALLESELFGYVRGAFTGADKDKKGLFVAADNGTLFLDEIGDLPLDMQVKLLRVLQNKEVIPLGGTLPQSVNARIIAATNRNLKDLIKQGKFREDLYYRIAVFPLFIQPLRDRKQDIPILARHFLSIHQPRSMGFTPRAMRFLESYHWPGNIRELANWVEYAAVLAGENAVEIDHFPLHMAETPKEILPQLAVDFPSLQELERRYIEMVLQTCGQQKAEACRILGISPVTLWRKKKHPG